MVNTQGVVVAFDYGFSESYLYFINEVVCHDIIDESRPSRDIVNIDMTIKQEQFSGDEI